MFRLIKLAIYALLGYMVYQFYQGLMQGGGSDQGRHSGSDLGRALNEDQGRMGTLTGPGRGTSVSVEDSDGGRHNQTVGRGVVSR
jgi:hypothetical protein